MTTWLAFICHARTARIVSAIALGFGCDAAGGADAPAKKARETVQEAAARDNVQWHDVTTWGVEGRAWADAPRLRYFDRLPAEAEKKVAGRVWSLSRDSTGMMTRFKTDARSIYVRYRLLKPRIVQAGMAATGVSGFDLYARDPSGRWRWVSATKPTQHEDDELLIRGLLAGEREYALYLPLFNGVEAAIVGVPAGAKFEGLAPRAKPIVFYGTSITHGAAASRAGMVHTAILGRRLDWPVVNLGFAANGKMDAEVGEFIGRIDAAAIVIDCLTNMSPAEVTAKCAPLVRQLRKARPGVPIVLVEDRRFTNSWITPGKASFHDANHAALRAAFELLRQEGVANLHYIPGDRLFGEDGEAGYDASHPTDLGFMRQADVMEPILRAALRSR